MQHKQNCAAERRLEVLFQRQGEALSTKQKERLLELRSQNEMVTNWLSILNEDEMYVVRRHLIDGISWGRLEVEHYNLWKEYGKNRRTLMRYQHNALERIQRFVFEEERLDS